MRWASDPSPLSRAEECYDPADVVWLANAAKSGVGREPLFECRVVSDGAIVKICLYPRRGLQHLLLSGVGPALLLNIWSSLPARPSW